MDGDSTENRPEMKFVMCMSCNVPYVDTLYGTWIPDMKISLEIAIEILL